MNSELFKAILAIDAYNRGYKASVSISGSQIGQATLELDSSELGTIVVNGVEIGRDEAIGFYAIAYNYNGETVISYRGTDNVQLFPPSDDVYHGWSLGGGNVDSEQAHMAIRFYQSVADAGNWLSANISLTGHSLGGGLAGLVGANDNTFSTERNAA